MAFLLWISSSVDASNLKNVQNTVCFQNESTMITFET